MHDTFFVVGKDEVSGQFITKYLSENWKRAISDACIVAMIYAFENNFISKDLSEEQKQRIEKTTKKSLDYFVANTLLSEQSREFFPLAKGQIFLHFRVWDERAQASEKKSERIHQTINALWFDEESGLQKGNQILILQRVCHALYKCWGDRIANIVMMHIWQIVFQQQLSFLEVKRDIIAIKEPSGKVSTNFGSLEKVTLRDLPFKPELKQTDRRERIGLGPESPFVYYEAVVTNPSFYNVKDVLVNVVNDHFNGFGVFVVHDKTINSKTVNTGQTVPTAVWKGLLGKIGRIEPDCWFFLKNLEGEPAGFALNRTKAHQDVLPSTLIDNDFIIATLKEIS